MILTGTEIIRQREAGYIDIDPFDVKRVNPNSYNLRLANTLRIYVTSMLDCRKNNRTRTINIPKEGIELYPNELYLGSTVERTSSDWFVPMLDGRSSLARLGISVHQTGGFGDVGFAGHWTLEITCVKPVRIYAGIEICQLQFWQVQGARMLYGRLKHKKSKYYEQGATPTPSKLFKEITGDIE